MAEKAPGLSTCLKRKLKVPSNYLTPGSGALTDTKKHLINISFVVEAVKLNHSRLCWMLQETLNPSRQACSTWQTCWTFAPPFLYAGVGRECPRQGQHRETRQPSFPFYKFVFPLPCLIIESVFERKKEKTQDSEYPFSCVLWCRR